MFPRRRRTSRNPRKRKTSRKAPKRRRTSRGTVRKGLLKIGGVRAEEFKGNDSTFKGRIVLDRGAGVVEFPNPEQFSRIAREEKITKEEVDKAFGHMKGLVKNAARGRRTAKRGSLFAPERLSGAEDPFYAIEVIVPAQFVSRVGAQRAVMMDLGSGDHRIARAVDGYRLAKPWVSKAEWQKAFGHLKGPLVGETRRSRGIPLTYQSRSMRLGHRNEEGDPVGGIVRGQLVLFHKPTGQIVWEAIDDTGQVEGKPVLIRVPGGEEEADRTAHVDLGGRSPSAMEGVRVGRGMARSQPVGAIDLGIPAVAMVEAFGHLLSSRARRRAFEVYSAPPPPPVVEHDE